MSGKRRAGTDINHDNWDQEEESEEAGTFMKASEQIIGQRVIKKARRRGGLNEDGTSSTKNVFSNFSGFAKLPSTTSSSNTPLNFLSNIGSQNTNFNATVTDNSIKNDDKMKIFNKSSKYHAQLKGLNESVSNWIKTHVDENPICILTPIFKDYEKYLKEIEAESKNNESHDTFLINKDKFTFENKKVTSENISSTTTNNNKNNISEKNDNIVTQIPKKSDLCESSIGKSLLTIGKNTNTNQNLTNNLSENKPFVTPLFTSAAFSSAQNSTQSPFSFGTSKPFAFANVSKPETTEQSNDVENESEEPPKAEFVQVVEEGSVYNVRCKVFTKKDSEFVERGVGQLYLKPVQNSEKTQLIVRADTNLGNLLINTLLSKSMPASKKGKNNIILVCIPTPESKPPPTTVLIKVKTSEDADKLLNLIEKHKK